MSEKLGTCDKKQYEHCGPHPRYGEIGQAGPPFLCVNWKPNPAPPTPPAGEPRKVGLKKITGFPIFTKCAAHPNRTAEFYLSVGDGGLGLCYPCLLEIKDGIGDAL